MEYVRVSVTENCNLNCIYCKPRQVKSDNLCCRNLIKHHELSPNDFGRIIEIMAKEGIKKVRITGGEPLVRNDICGIIQKVANIEGISDIAMTTNGILLDGMVKELKNAGLMRLNISLDSLVKEKFHRLTGGNLSNVLAGIDKALKYKISPIRINVVLIKGINDDEIDDFINLTRDNAIDVRFIELMPIGRFGEENRKKIVYSNSIISSHPNLKLCDDRIESLPAQYYSIKGFKGRVGFISPIGHKFCQHCNRIRLTADGKLKPCLGNNGEVDLSEALKKESNELYNLILSAIYNKPKGHSFADNFYSKRDMSGIGG